MTTAAPPAPATTAPPAAPQPAQGAPPVASPNHNAFLESFGYAAPGGPEPGTEPPAQGEAPPPAQGAAPAAEVPPAAPAQAEPPSPFADLIKGAPALKPWSDEAKALFKELGIEDPDAFIAQSRTSSEQYRIMQEEHERATAMLEAEKELDPMVQELIQMAREGENPIEWARKQPQIDLLKPAAKHDKLELVRAYFDKAFSREDIEAYEAKDDPEAVKRFEQRLDEWFPLAAEKHEAARQGPIAARAAKAATTKEFNQNYEKAVAANASHIKEKYPSMMAACDAATIRDFATGKTIRDTFCETDGKTPKPTALADLIFIRNRTAILKLVEETAYARGVEEGRLRSGAALPTTQANAGREGFAPAQQAEVNKAGMGVLKDFAPATG